MAAPTENVDDDGENESQDEESDISSSKFDPLRALYSPDINIPYPDVKIFNNVAEYESSFIKRNKPGPSQPQITKTLKHVGTKPSTCKQKTTNADNKPVLQLPDPSMPAVRQRMLRNVLTRMDQSFISGPLSILRRCVQEKLKAHVWTRGARSVRGVLKGYVIAFDKHFNLALVDVDEVYRIPSACRKRRKQKLEKEETSVIKKESERTQKSKHQEQRRSVKDRLSLPQRSDSSKTYRGREGVSHRLSQHSGEPAKRESALPCEAAWLGMRAEDLRVRHVNQLFVRGDNVVCVNILNKES